jgi:hypothetical protein
MNVNIFVIHLPLQLVLTHFCLIHRCVVLGFLVVRNMQETVLRDNWVWSPRYTLGIQFILCNIGMKVICFRHDR